MCIRDRYTGDGGQVIYDVNPGHTEQSVLVIVDGAIIPPQQYTIVGTVLTLNSAPAQDVIVDIRYLPA